MYQTSGELVEPPHGGGMDPPGEGVAHAVLPHAAGEPALRAMASAQLSLIGGVVVAWILRRKSPVLLPFPATRRW